MYERYPISGIKQSYRHASRSRTIVMPILILSLLGGLAWFYIQSDPEKMAARKESVRLENTPHPGATHIVPGKIVSLTKTGGSESFPAGQDTVPKKTKGALQNRLGTIASNSTQSTISPGTPTGRALSPKEISERPSLGKDFTPWLSPLALDSYMRAKDQGHTVGFWDRGHWMTSIEGRWKDGSHEFRIRYAKTPNKPDWRWEYRINLTPEQFLETHAHMRENGFSLVSSQSFQHPDKKRRYQAVWQSHPTQSEMTSNSHQTGSTVDLATVEELEGPPITLRYSPTPADVRTPERLFGESNLSNPQLATNPSGGTALDVNRLQFRR